MVSLKVAWIVLLSNRLRHGTPAPTPIELDNPCPCMLCFSLHSPLWLLAPFSQALQGLGLGGHLSVHMQAVHAPQGLMAPEHVSHVIHGQFIC